MRFRERELFLFFNIIRVYQLTICSRPLPDMAKRPVKEEEGEVMLKNGQRPPHSAEPQEELDFEDDFEDEFESEEEILQAGVDGRPDAEREEERTQGMFREMRYPAFGTS